MKILSTVVRPGACALAAAFCVSTAFAQIGRRFPSEKKIVNDPVTGVELTFLTSKPAGDSKIYQTHQQWTADGKWLVFRCQGEALAVNEASGAIVQLTSGWGGMGMLCLAHGSMKLYYMRSAGPRADRPPLDRDRTPPPPPAGGARGRGGNAATAAAADTPGGAAPASAAATTAQEAPAGGQGRGGFNRGQREIVELNLEPLFADSEADKVGAASTYERVCGRTPEGMSADGNMGIDAGENYAYFRISGADLAAKLPEGARIAERFGPRGMGAGPNGLASMNLKTGEVKFVVAVPFQVGHVQTNPWMPGEIVFCWETGGKAPQRMWTVKADGTGLRPLYPEPEYDWVTHEAVISKDEVAFAILGHRSPATATRESDWGIAGTRMHPTGLAIVNLRTGFVHIAGQTKTGSGLWHVAGSADGRWAAGDDFSRGLYLIDRKSDQMILLTTGHKPGAADHPHPTFNADGTKIEIQSAMLSADGRSLNICIVPVPKQWLERAYSNRLGE